MGEGRAIDAHTHFWNPGRARPSWLGPSERKIDARFEPDVLEPELARNDVSSAIVVQSDRSDADTDYALALAEETEWIGAVVAWADLRSVSRTRSRLAQLAEAQKIRGVGDPLSDDASPGWLVNRETLRSVELVQQNGLVLEVAPVFPAQLRDVGEVAATFPQLTVVVDHLGKPPVGTSAMKQWSNDLRAAAEHPNVYAKVSGLTTTVSDTRWSDETFAPAIRDAVRAFGPMRLMAGSDWPVCLLNGSYDRVWRTTKRLIHDVLPGFEQLVMGATASRVFGLAT
jgi:L-fuconolactonase